MAFYANISPAWGDLLAAIVSQAAEDYTQALRNDQKMIHNGYHHAPPEVIKKEIKDFIKKSPYASGFVDFKDFDCACKKRAMYYNWRETHNCAYCHITSCPLFTIQNQDFTHGINFECVKGVNDGKTNTGTCKIDK